MKYFTYVALMGFAAAELDVIKTDDENGVSIQFKNENGESPVFSGADWKEVRADMRDQYKAYMKDYWSEESRDARREERTSEAEAKWEERDAELSCSATSECDQDSRNYVLCCNEATITDSETDTTETVSRCMSQAVAEFNSEMSMGKYDVSMQCLGSGAKALAAGAVAIGLALY